MRAVPYKSQSLQTPGGYLYVANLFVGVLNIVASLRSKESITSTLQREIEEI